MLQVMFRKISNKSFNQVSLFYNFRHLSLRSIFILSILIPVCYSNVKSVKTSVTKTIIPLPTERVKLTTDARWIQASLERHNYLRSLHMASPLTLNTTLCEISQAWVNYLLARSLNNIRTKEDVMQDKFFFDHNYKTIGKYSIGENLHFGTHAKDTQINGSYAVTRWYNEIADYDFKFARVKLTSRPDSLIGHFTQLVWKSTSQMGTAFATGKLPTGQLVTFVAANYFPGGNVLWSAKFPEKLYIENVAPPVTDSENEVEDVIKVIQDKIKFWEISTNGITTPQSWIDQGLDKHNAYRIHHGFPVIRESSELSTVAQSWANKLVVKGVSDFNSRWTIDGHYGFKNYAATMKAEFGESVIYFVGDGLVDPGNVVQLWYEQHVYYDFGNGRPNFNKSKTAQTHGFEQVMWKETTHFGMAFASKEAENGQIISFVVANYYPRRPDGATFKENMENLPTNESDKLRSTAFIFVLTYFILQIVM